MSTKTKETPQLKRAVSRESRSIFYLRYKMIADMIEKRAQTDSMGELERSIMQPFYYIQPSIALPILL